MLRYVGWVPTANGRLSFRHIGATKLLGFYKYANTIDANRTRFIVGVQRRDLSDLLFRPITEIIWRRNGRHWFFILCQTSQRRVNDLDALEGAIYIVRPQSKKSILDRTNIMDSIRTLQDHHLNPNADLDIKAAAACAKTSLDKIFDMKLSFSLYRDGEVRMHSPVCRNDDIEKHSDIYARERGVPFLSWASNQSYFFLRDFCHIHQHHNPKIDTIICLQEDGGKEAEWRNHILYSMHHYVIQMRRGAKRFDLTRGLGVLAYCRAFVGISHVRNRNSWPLSIFQTEAIAASLQSKIAELAIEDDASAENDERAVAKSVGYRNLLFIAYLTVLVIAVTLFVPSIEDHKKYWIDNGDWVVQRWKPIAGSLFIVFLFTYKLTSVRSFKARFWRNNILWIKDIFLILIVNRRASGILLFIASVLAILAAIVVAFNGLR